MLFGVAGGLAEYFDVKPKFVRIGLLVLGLILFIVWPFVAIILGVAYSALAFFMAPPERDP